MILLVDMMSPAQIIRHIIQGNPIQMYLNLNGIAFITGLTDSNVYNSYRNTAGTDMILCTK